MQFSPFTLALITLGAGLAVIVHAAGFPLMGGMAYGPAFFPVMIGAGFMLCGLVLLGQAVLSRGDAPLSLRRIGLIGGVRIGAILMLILAFAILAPVAGFLPTTAAACLAAALIFSLRPCPALALALVTAAALFVLFQIGLRVPLPLGPIERWLG